MGGKVSNTSQANGFLLFVGKVQFSMAALQGAKIQGKNNKKIPLYKYRQNNQRKPAGATKPVLSVVERAAMSQKAPSPVNTPSSFSSKSACG